MVAGDTHMDDLAGRLLSPFSLQDHWLGDIPPLESTPFGVDFDPICSKIVPIIANLSFGTANLSKLLPHPEVLDKLTFCGFILSFDHGTQES